MKWSYFYNIFLDKNTLGNWFRESDSKNNGCLDLIATVRLAESHNFFPNVQKNSHFVVVLAYVLLN